MVLCSGFCFCLSVKDWVVFLFIILFFISLSRRKLFLESAVKLVSAPVYIVCGVLHKMSENGNHGIFRSILKCSHKPRNDTISRHYALLNNIYLVLTDHDSRAH